MREILFRGKESREKGEFVEGAYYHQTEFYGHKEFNKRNKVDEHYIITSTDELEDNMMTFSAVFPETVGQYTGLTDKNGIKIFEGDILKGVSKWLNEPINGFVAFKNGVFGFIWYRGKTEEFTSFSSVHEMNYEVIGNIHDNPELLGGDN